MPSNRLAVSRDQLVALVDDWELCSAGQEGVHATVALYSLL